MPPQMGLGKTISALALMVSRPSSDRIKTNLIVGPIALLKQWEIEIKKVTLSDSLFPPAPCPVYSALEAPASGAMRVMCFFYVFPSFSLFLSFSQFIFPFHSFILFFFSVDALPVSFSRPILGLSLLPNTESTKGYLESVLTHTHRSSSRTTG